MGGGDALVSMGEIMGREMLERSIPFFGCFLTLKTLAERKLRSVLSSKSIVGFFLLFAKL
jgi:hypothetical protein